MAKLKVENAVDHLDHEFKKALDDTMREFAPGVRYDSGALFRFFLRRVYQHCSTWEDIPITMCNSTKFQTRRPNDASNGENLSERNIGNHRSRAAAQA